jgi:hypothetical protein
MARSDVGPASDPTVWVSVENPWGEPHGIRPFHGEKCSYRQVPAQADYWNSRATYGYRRVWAMVSGTFRAANNRKRIRRVVQLHGLMLARGSPPPPRIAAFRPDPAAGVD